MLYPVYPVYKVGRSSHYTGNNAHYSYDVREE